MRHGYSTTSILPRCAVARIPRAHLSKLGQSRYDTSGLNGKCAFVFHTCC